MKFLRSSFLLALMTVLYISFAASPPSLGGQSTANQAPAVQPAVPTWQIDAGGQAKFDVASVKQDTAVPSSQTVSSNVPLDPMDAFTPTGGLFTATNQPLAAYMVLAYKLSPEQTVSIQSQLPRWANANRYDIQAKVSDNPTKDQMRLIMQALLADGFKLVIHHETRQVPVLALVMEKPGRPDHNSRRTQILHPAPARLCLLVSCHSFQRRSPADSQRFAARSRRCSLAHLDGSALVHGVSPCLCSLKS